jgi:hypothetical protein
MRIHIACGLDIYTSSLESVHTRPNEQGSFACPPKKQETTIEVPIRYSRGGLLTSSVLIATSVWLTLLFLSALCANLLYPTRYDNRGDLALLQNNAEYVATSKVETPTEDGELV